MLELKNINVSFGTNHVLKDVSCTVDTGDFIVVVGANGAGKSTLFDAIAGKIKPTNGSITLDGIDITNAGEIQRASMVTRLFQNPHLNSVGSMTVAQNLAMAHYSRRSARLVDGMNGLTAEKAEEILSPLQIDTQSILQKPMNSLSGGQRQLIAFIMSTQQAPKILLLDEPTAALDPQTATKLLKFAYQFVHKHKTTTLLITHDPHIALSLGNKIWILEDGRITRQFGAKNKKNLNAEHLIGHIDYAALSNVS
jgi:putative tryptophan/tyrosine transport system ATP-binding protein